MEKLWASLSDGAWSQAIARQATFTYGGTVRILGGKQIVANGYRQVIPIPLLV